MGIQFKKEITEESLRTFIALELDPAVRETLAGLQGALKKLDLDVKWVKPQNIHITLKFLGQIRQKKIKAIVDIFAEMYDSTEPFEVRLTTLGAFPNVRRPKVIWAGLEDSNGQLKTLASRTEEILCRLGFPKEQREFTSHITLGRVRSFKNLPRLSKALEEIKVPFQLNQHFNTVTFFKSTLTPQGPIYESLLTYELKK